MKEITIKEITIDNVIKELKFNHSFLNKVWPIVRNSVKKKLTPRCSICTLSEKYVHIENGVCDICRSNSDQTIFDPIKSIDYQKSGQELDQLLKAAQGKGKGSYDVLYFYSGGKDSTYLLHKLITQFPGLRILAFTVDNGFRSPYASRNVKLFCQAFQVDLMEISLYKIFQKLYKYGFENFSYQGFYATDICQGELFQDIGRNTAAQMEIPYVILGYTPEQVAVIPPEFNTNIYNVHQFVYQENQKFKRESFLDTRLDKIFTEQEMKYWWNAENWPEERIPVMILPFLGWGYNKTDVLKEFSQFGMLTERDPMLTNDLYWVLGFYLDLKILGYASFEQEWAIYVRTGRADRTYNRNSWEAYEYFNTYLEKVHSESKGMKWVLAKLQINPADLPEIIERNRRKLIAQASGTPK